MDLEPSSASAAAVATPRLPVEVILQIIEAVVPGDALLIFPPSSEAGRTLLSLTRVSRATYELASRLLRQQCMFIDSSRRLGDVLLCVPRLVPSMPPVLSLQNMTCLYLRPFRSSLDDLPTAMWVRELFCEVCDTLRRLVVQMPFSSLDPWDDHLSVKRTLRDGFQRLHRLEEFVCLGEYPILSYPGGETDVWRLWPELQRLVLFGVPLGNHWLWWDIATLPKLQHVVLARPQHLQGTNIKDEYFHKLPRDDPRLARAIKIVLMDAAYEMGAVSRDRWAEIDPEGKMTVALHEFPISFYGDETLGDLVTDWVRRGALNGQLWDWAEQVL